ncbi:hypothetical protein ED733_007440 [Metarhizium rileyi]|uniref:Uncharacterized protein n=1 Tax=Metarhizium rileyi (strain RCEF 4871) TaxID=1649241 RepID=A0A5C6GMI0_METRR|nr:hypothetical protein ED733_007440 [Metarhizium rileyi]
MKVPWYQAARWTAFVLLAQSGEGHPEPPARILRPEEFQPLSFSDLDGAASYVIQRLKEINPNGKVMVIGGTATQKYLPGLRSTRDVDIYQTVGSSLDIKKQLLSDARFYTRRKLTDNIDITEKEYLFFQNADGKNIEIDLPGKHVLSFEPTSAQLLKDIPPGNVPYISVEELIVSKIQAIAKRTDAASKALDLRDAKALLERYPKLTFSNENHLQMVEKFRTDHKLPSKFNTHTSDKPSAKQESLPKPLEEGGKLKSAAEKAKAVEMTPAKQTELMTLAEKISEEEFTNIAKRNKLQAVVERRWRTTLSEARLKVLGYKKTMHMSLDQTTTATRLRAQLKVGTGALAAVGIGLYVKGVIDAFTTESSDWEKTAAVTAIIPFVGCHTNMIASAQKENAHAGIIAVDTSLCLLGDMLLLGGWTAPLGIIIHLVRFLIQYFEPPPALPSYEQIKEMRDRPWRSFLDEHLTRTIASKQWRDKLEGALAIKALEVWSQAADRVGILEAGSQLISQATGEGMGQTHNFTRRQDTGTDLDLNQTQAEIGPAIAKTWQRANEDIIRRQRQYLLSLPQTLRDELNVSIKATAKEYNDQFIVKLTAEDTIKKYPGYSKAIAWLFSEETVYAESRGVIERSSEKIKNELPPLPSLFTLSYFVGVAAGVDDLLPPKINPHGGPGFAKYTAAEPDEWKSAVNSIVVDPVRYYREKTGGENQKVLVQQTVDVVYHLLGKLHESRLSTEIPGLTDAREFQMLLAMYIGNTFADWKEIQGNRVGYIHDDFVHDMPAFIERVYDISVSVAAEHILNIS